MVRILVRFVGRPYNMTNKREVWLHFSDCDKVTFKDLLNRLEVEIGVKFNVGRGGIIALINGRNVDHIGGLNADLKDQDEVTIASIAGGG
ncbi:MAG: MoaD/ThiS family protein [Candidatus Bathyarchaeia archaeon]